MQHTRLLATVCSLAVALSLAACSKTEEPAAPAKDGEAPTMTEPAGGAQTPSVSPAQPDSPMPQTLPSQTEPAAPQIPATPAPQVQATPTPMPPVGDKPDEAVLGALGYVAGMHALGVECGKMTVAQTAAEVARIRNTWTASGKITAKQFDTMYAAAFDGTTSRMKQEPEEVKQACGQYEQLVAKGEQAAQAVGLSGK